MGRFFLALFRLIEYNGLHMTTVVFLLAYAIIVSVSGV